MRKLKAKGGNHLQPLLLVILDGFGLHPAGKSNAITRAHTPNIHRFFHEYPWCKLDPSGEAVGLPRHQMGTSEVGHLNLGAGRVVDQDLVRINKAIADNTFFTNRSLLMAMRLAKRPGAALHLLGLCSDGGVHSHIDHLFALLDMAKLQGVRNVFIHAITDGRDTPPKIAKRFLKQINEKIKELGLGEIATVVGRYYAMDRDNRWEREQLAYDALVRNLGERAATPEDAVRHAYQHGESDEFIKPTIIGTTGARTSTIIDGDSVIFFNFRQDRARQLSHGFTDYHFTKFKRDRLKLLFTTFTSYEKKLRLPVAFPPERVPKCLGEWLSNQSVRQFHIAETEKYAHVTYFFNGGRERPFIGEERIIIPSPRIATYDTLPGMSAREITHQLTKKLQKGVHGFYVANYANADMVGHTGKLQPTIEAVEMLDKCLSKLESVCKLHKIKMVVTADHGNAEEMSGKYQTSHTLNKVPFILLDESFRLNVKEAIPADVAPTLLSIMGLPIPKEMTGRVLVTKF